MTGLNLTIKETNINYLQQPYVPDSACFDWCSAQHLVHSSNVAVYSVAIVGVAYGLLVAIPFFREHETLKEYTDILEYLSRLMLIIFFAYYFLYVRWGIF